MRYLGWLGVAFVASCAAVAGGGPYDDRAMIRRATTASRALLRLVPGPRSAESQHARFKTGPVADRVTELRKVRNAVAPLVRRAGQDKEITKHRRTLVDLTLPVLARVEAYGRTAAALASAGKRLAEVKRTEPHC